jgi:hypothetical protein
MTKGNKCTTIEGVSLDLSYNPIRPARTPGQQVVLNLQTFGPKRMDWGVATPLIVRSRGWEPTKTTPATVRGSVQSCYGDWWVVVDVPLLSAGGEVLATAGMLLPPNVITAA